MDHYKTSSAFSKLKSGVKKSYDFSRRVTQYAGFAGSYAKAAFQYFWNGPRINRMAFKVGVLGALAVGAWNNKLVINSVRYQKDINNKLKTIDQDSTKTINPVSASVKAEEISDQLSSDTTLSEYQQDSLYLVQKWNEVLATDPENKRERRKDIREIAQTAKKYGTLFVGVSEDSTGSIHMLSYPVEEFHQDFKNLWKEVTHQDRETDKRAPTPSDTIKLR